MSVAHSDVNFSDEQMLGFYRDMLRIRRIEERIGDDAKAGNIPGAVHLYIGQEAVGVGFCSQLTDDDWIASTHRGHGHYLAKGGDSKLLMAEIYGRETGVCKGHGGSMHVADFSKGIIGANGIVGAGISIITGAAWAAQMDGKGAVGVAFFGDGAANQGVLCEALNVAVLWKLPVIFVCENNGFSEFSPSSTVTAGNIVDRAKPYGAAHETVDGNDLIAVHQCAARAIKQARAGNGPFLIEARTYRQRGHVEAEASFLGSKYRSDEEVAEWIARDPIPAFAKRVMDAGQASQADLDRIETEVAAEVAEAVRFADGSPYPDPALQGTSYMFA
ncbi:MAG: thiamine pyrophosphate-dependent dehydrogenase E1 component subunit alpha [Boseongicola sp. SB0670_bin_30]|nr:thiamine pyrophosphate-dependent dehydrogenase E1 component subunit alpha [Boseongicola sp. SB0670_bin_30]